MREARVAHTLPPRTAPRPLLRSYTVVLDSHHRIEQARATVARILAAAARESE